MRVSWLLFARVAWIGVAASCTGTDTFERGLAPLADAPAAGASELGVETWSLYGAEEPVGTGVLAEGVTAEGWSYTFEALAEDDGNTAIILRTPHEQGQILFAPDGTLLEASIPESDEVLLALSEIDAAFVDGGQDPGCPGCAGAGPTGAALGWTAVGTCALTAGLYVAAALQLGLNVVVDVGTEVARNACLVSISVYSAYKIGERDGTVQGAADAGFPGEPPTVAGTWRDEPQPQRVPLPHPYPLDTTLVVPVSCPPAATHVRVRFRWVELDRVDGIEIFGYWNDQPLLVELLSRLGRRATSVPIRGSRALVQLRSQARRFGGNPWGFEIEGVECFFPESGL